uniref:Uncharacterized protein n=1 Tax=Meloidogyne enterolobii TaxID=390850 RepID=A0A6V7WGX2_MELEN|nr:unnamed protein product [Meloidogyne enterolobii]
MSIQKQTLFDVYGDKGLPADLITINVIRIAIATIGIFLNASVVYVTVKCKTLKSPCHFLLAFECFSNAVFQTHSWLSITVIFNPGHQFIDMRFCCKQLILIFIVGFTTSLQRHYSYLQRIVKRTFYLIPMICTLFICPAIIIWAIYQIVNTMPETSQIICAPHECTVGWAGDLSYFIFSVINFLTLVNYIIVWIALKWHVNKNQNQASFEWTHRIIKTLAVLMAFNLVGHSMNSIARMTVPRLDLDITQSTIVTHSLSCLTNFVMASDGPILYLSNQEYRQAFHKVFKIKTNSVATAVTVKHISKNNLNKNNGQIPVN